MDHYHPIARNSEPQTSWKGFPEASGASVAFVAGLAMATAKLKVVIVCLD